MEFVASYRDALRARGFDPSPVDRLIAGLVEAGPTDRAGLFATLDERANSLDWLHDCDYAAVALQAAAASTSDMELRRQMLSVALRRAGWCASGATSGGEGTARVRHVHEIEALLARPE